MIILDTNVLSELMRPTPNPRVVAWSRSHSVTSLFTTAITEAEVLYGFGILPKGRRRAALEAAATSMFRLDFGGRVLPFGSDAARAYAIIAAERRRLGRPISQYDAQIAAIARSAGASLATRNTADFEHCELTLVNPFDSVGPDA